MAPHAPFPRPVGTRGPVSFLFTIVVGNLFNSEVPHRWAAVKSMSSGSPQVRPMGVHRTCGDPNQTWVNTHARLSLYRSLSGNAGNDYGVAETSMSGDDLRHSNLINKSVFPMPADGTLLEARRRPAKLNLCTRQHLRKASGHVGTFGGPLHVHTSAPLQG